MKATILDTITGKTKQKNGIDSFQWAENNWSCDCNRNYFGVEGKDTEYCLGGKRFLVIKAEFENDEMRYTLEELNADYPEDLIKKHLGNL